MICGSTVVVVEVEGGRREGFQWRGRERGGGGRRAWKAGWKGDNGMKVIVQYLDGILIRGKFRPADDAITRLSARPTLTTVRANNPGLLRSYHAVY
jgi:hypothetical protein